MKKALVSGSYILDVCDAEFPVHPDLIWVDVPDDTRAQHDTYANGAVVKPAAPSHNEQIDTQIKEAEGALPITPRALREFMLMVLAFAHVSPSVNPKFLEIAALDTTIQGLRGQRT